MNFNENTKLADLLSNADAVKVLEKHLPTITTNAMISSAASFSLKLLAAFPQANLSEEMIAAIVADLKMITFESSSVITTNADNKTNKILQTIREDVTIKSKELIQIRDPFVLRNESDQLYYLYGTTDRDTWNGPGRGFDVYRSKDLDQWEGPYPAFRPKPDFWATMNYWAPEVHQYKGQYYMLASFKANEFARGTQVLVSNEPIGPFRPHSNMPVTPKDWECLDGTLYIDETDQPWMVFCHEWTQIENGTIDAIRLTESLDGSVGDPITLFAATEATWVSEINPGVPFYVTDGPFMHRCKDGTLLMLWSSFKDGKYAQAIAKSESGQIQGPWIQNENPLFEGDGGHGMLFKSFDGELMLALHSPNDTPNERVMFIRLREANGNLFVV
ncbi:glycoside hydrolase family 43 protein [Paenibacillus sp. YIM B09110]|uniref:glycoside hydrolase family 43 protein n=1 Tax=Paenibacillus sp. YIM B09110 TaxID=3126102 RepID=UPI00301BF3FE